MKLLNTSQVYGEKYCKRIDAKEWRHRLTTPTMKVIYDHFKPKSVIDFGCANGLHLKAFKEFGVERLFGIEGTKHWAPYIEKYFGKSFIIKDMREPINVPPKFDLAISFEVLEHLENECADQAVENLVNSATTVCCSANPTTGGFHHLNAKPKEYWVEKFESLGMTYCQTEVNLLQETFSKMSCSGWFKTGLMVFR